MVEVEHLPALGTAFRSKQPAVVLADAKPMHVTSASAMALHLLLSDCSWSFQLCKWSETTQTRLSKLSPSDAKSEIGYTIFILLSNFSTFAVCPTESAEKPSGCELSATFPAGNTSCLCVLPSWELWVQTLASSGSESWKCPQFYLQATAWSPAIYVL